MEPKHFNRFFTCFTRLFLSLIGAGVTSLIIYLAFSFFIRINTTDLITVNNNSLNAFVGIFLLYPFLVVMFFLLSNKLIKRAR